MSDLIKWMPCTVNNQGWMEPHKDGKFVGIESYDQLVAQIEQVTKERDEFKLRYEESVLGADADCHLITKIQQQLTRVTEQRDRAMDAARWLSVYQEGTTREQTAKKWLEQLEEEIAKEKEAV